MKQEDLLTEWKQPSPAQLQQIHNPHYKPKTKTVLYKTGKRTIGINDKEIVAPIRKLFYNYCKNLRYIVDTVGIKNYYKACREQNLPAGLQVMYHFLKGEKKYSIHPNNLGVTAHMTKLPIGVLLASDIEWLHKNQVLSFEGVEARISPAYITDGFFFYPCYLDRLTPVGNSELNEYVEKNYQVKPYTLKP